MQTHVECMHLSYAVVLDKSIGLCYTNNCNMVSMKNL